MQIARVPRVALLGAGSMGGAILAGLLADPGACCEQITVTTRSARSAANLVGTMGVRVWALESEADANRLAVRGANIVILAVKPWLVHELLREIAAELEPDAIVVSLAAGVTTASMEALLPAGIAVLRAMPNTPSHLGLGVTGLAAGSSAGAEAVEKLRGIFLTIGSVLVVPEAQINAVAAVSGSGPAYLFYYIEQMTAAAVRLGFNEDQARLLAEDTVIGAAALLRASGEDPAALRSKVTSPKGTTEQAILVLEEAGIGELFDRALAANIRRSEELERGENSASSGAVTATHPA